MNGIMAEDSENQAHGKLKEVIPCQEGWDEVNSMACQNPLTDKEACQDAKIAMRVMLEEMGVNFEVE